MVIMPMQINNAYIFKNLTKTYKHFEWDVMVKFARNC